MKVLIVLILILGAVLARRCKPKYHFWRPYNGTIPNDAFLAGVDADGKKSYVAKIIPLDQYLWTIPAQMKEACDHVDFAWCCGSSYNLLRVDKFIEILCTEKSENLTWRRVNFTIREAAKDCCLVEGGIALWSNAIYTAYVSRGVRDGNNYIGRAYVQPDWPGLHTMDGGNSTKILEHFDVLAYDCLQKNPNEV